MASLVPIEKASSLLSCLKGQLPWPPWSPQKNHFLLTISEKRCLPLPYSRPSNTPQTRAEWCNCTMCPGRRNWTDGHCLPKPLNLLLLYHKPNDIGIVLNRRESWTWQGLSLQVVNKSFSQNSKWPGDVDVAPESATCYCLQAGVWM